MKRSFKFIQLVNLSFLLFTVICANLAFADEWLVEDQKDGIHGYVRQLPAFQADDDFYATKSIWIFGPGDAMLIEWVKNPTTGKFNIKFSFLDKPEVNQIAAAPDRAARDALLATMTAGALTQTTADTFDDQGGLYDQLLVTNKWLVEILMDPTHTPEFNTLLDAKYGIQEPFKDFARNLIDDLTLDAQIYPASGSFASSTRVAIHYPGYMPGGPGGPGPGPNDNTKEGWNSTISMEKDPSLFMNAQGLTYNDMVNSNRHWAVIMGWNTHLDYDGKETASKNVATDEPDHANYTGMITPVGETEKGSNYRAMALLDTTWAGVPLSGDINVVSHSTGYYLATDFLHYLPDLWPSPTNLRYFGISPNIRGSTMIGGNIGPQDYDSMDDMYRDNWHWVGGYRKNEATRALLEYRDMTDVEAYILLAYGDTTTGGVGGSFVTIPGDNGVVDYSNYQPHTCCEANPENLDDNEYGRMKRFIHYESLFNMRNDGGPPVVDASKATWEDGGDNYLRIFPESNTEISVFGENVDLREQQADDGENYSKDHSDLAQRMMFMKIIVSGTVGIDIVPDGGIAQGIIFSEITPGTVDFTWTQSPDQSPNDTPASGPVGKQLYEVVRKLEGNVSISQWHDRWWQRVKLRDANGETTFTENYRTFETIRNTQSLASEDHDLWRFLSDIDSEYINMPTWLDRAFNEKDLWVRVQNGPLEGGFFKVEENQDFMGIGFTDNGALTSPLTFPDKLNITLNVEDNPVFVGLKPDANEGSIGGKVNYITLGGIKYLYNAAFYGPNDTVRNLVLSTTYSDSAEETNKGTGHFFSVDLGQHVSHLTDTIAPTILFE